jgi:hypothetical protein
MFDGDIASLNIWGRALNATEVAALHNYGAHNCLY